MKSAAYLLFRILILNLVIAVSVYCLGQIGILIELKKLVLPYFPLDAYIASFLLCNLAYTVGVCLAFIHNKLWNKEETIKQIETPYFKGTIVLLGIITVGSFNLFII